MKFYRIEAEGGKGPYDACVGVYDARDIDFDSDPHPLPNIDGIPETGYLHIEEARFGFISIEQALDWFTDGMLDILAAEYWRQTPLPWNKDLRGFALSVYEIDPEKVSVGGRQAVAPVANMEPVDRISIDELQDMRKGGPQWTTNDRPSMTSPSISNEQGSSAPVQRSARLYMAPSGSMGKSPTLEQLSHGVRTGSISALSLSGFFESPTMAQTV